MFPDYHVHTEFSGDSQTPVKEQIDQAIKLGMTQLCITDHHDYDINLGDVDFTLNFDQYLPCLIELKEMYQTKIKLKIGLELGLQPHLARYHQELVARYPLDFIIGSTHSLDGMDPFYPSFFDGRIETEVYQQFFAFTLANLNAFSTFEVLGHLDYIVRYGPTKSANYRCSDYQDLIDQILSLAIEKGVGLECNTAGYRKGLNQPNPHHDILKRYHELGGEIITIGSDAHTPQELGCDFNTAAERLKSCGFRYFTTFEQRQPVFLPIDF